MGNSLTRRNTLDQLVDGINTRIINFHRRRITNAADAIDRQDYVTLRQLLELLEGLAPGGGGTGSNQIQEYTMNAAPYSVPTVTVVNGDDLTIYLTQDGSGSRYPDWAGTHYELMPTAVDPTAGTVSIIGAKGYGGKWRWDGRFATGI